MTLSKTVLKQLDGVDWDFAGYNPNGRSTGIHNIHWYPAPFPSGVAGTLIDILGSDSCSFLDPFCGSSVAPLEAWFRGKRSFGIDNNSFAIDLATAKIQLISDATADTAKQLLSDYSKFRRREISIWSNLKPEAVCEKAQINIEAIKWFVPKVLTEIAIAKNWIVCGGKLASHWENTLTVSLSSLLHGRFSIARNYHYTYVVDNSKVKEKAQEVVDVEGIFSNKIVDNMIQGQLTRERLSRINFDFGSVPLPKFSRGFAQETGNYIPEKIDLVVTSPPYFGMNDYVRSQYLSWLIFGWKDFVQDLETESGSRRRRNSRTFYNRYFDDMYATFSEIRNVLQKDGYLAVILGSSTIKLAREMNPLIELFSQLEDIGFRFCWKGQRRVRFRKINNTPFRDEVIWVFKN